MEPTVFSLESRDCGCSYVVSQFKQSVIYYKQKDQTITYVAVKYMTCNDARPIINTYKRHFIKSNVKSCRTSSRLAFI